MADQEKLQSNNSNQTELNASSTNKESENQSAAPSATPTADQKTDTSNDNV